MCSVAVSLPLHDLGPNKGVLLLKMASAREQRRLRLIAVEEMKDELWF